MAVVKKLRKIIQTPAGNPCLGLTPIQKDTLVHVHGSELDAKGKALITTIDPDNPLFGEMLKPGKTSPICGKCGLADMGDAKNPYMFYNGPEEPLITMVFDSVSSGEDQAGILGNEGPPAMIKKILGDDPRFKDYLSLIRWAPITRCYGKIKGDKIKTRGNHCRSFLIQDLDKHRPSLIVPVGTSALGLLSHKSNAQEWSGKVLTYRGWPDDWLTDPDYVLPRAHPDSPEKTLTGHPIFGKIPDWKVPMFPLQSPRLVWATRNPYVIKRWKGQLLAMMEKAISGVPPMSYDRPWFRITEDPDEIMEAMNELIANPGTVVCYDTETKGLKPWAQNQSVVFMMFRWVRKDGSTHAIGFPWDYAESALKPHLEKLAPTILEAMYVSKLVGHNLTFDVLYTYGTVPGCDLNRLADAALYDTWHMLYTMKQQPGMLSLDLIAYDWVPDMAGYEEEMTLLIKLHGDLLHPGNNKGGHYANCPRDKWNSHLKPYVMGDVEVCHRTFEKVQEKLTACKRYTIPIAHTTERGRFRSFSPPDRNWVYHNIVSPASRVLMKMMGRGVHVDVDELTTQEDLFPKKILELKQSIKTVTPNVVAWCEQQEATEPDWVFDPENKEQLKTILFGILDLPVQRLTKTGKQKHGETEDDWKGLSREDLLEYAAMDKYTLNKLAVDHPEVRPLQEYRKIFKQYTSYIRPMRNSFYEGVDKKHRDKDVHLGKDGCVHTSFLITGTRGGRLSSREPNLQQLNRDGLVKRVYNTRFGQRGALYQADLSQIELRLLAAACGDRSMVKAYWDDIDLHALTHSLIYRRPYEECTKEHVEALQKAGKSDSAKKISLERKVAKTVNFLTGYGGGAFGLQTSLAQQGVYMSIEECESILENFFDSYPALRSYLSNYKRFIMDKGVAVSILGRVRIFEEIFSDDNEAINKALRAGCNHLIQSTASDMMLIMLCAIEHLMRKADLESMLVSTVHDSLLIDSVREELPIIHEISSEVLNNMPDVFKAFFGDDFDTSWMIVPFAGDAEVSPWNYLDMTSVPGKGAVDWDRLLAPKAKK